MFHATTWKRWELDRLDDVLEGVPERHLRYNEALSEIARNDYLRARSRTSLSAAGCYRTRTRSVTVFNPAFWGLVALGDRELPVFDFTLRALVGFSLFATLEVRKHWPPIVYPRFDRGSGSSPVLKVVDAKLLSQELRLSQGRVDLNADRVSLDRAFAYCYAGYTLFPGSLQRSLPDAFHYLGTRVFAGTKGPTLPISAWPSGSTLRA